MGRGWRREFVLLLADFHLASKVLMKSRLEFSDSPVFHIREQITHRTVRQPYRGQPCTSNTHHTRINEFGYGKKGLRPIAVP